ncbi:MAG: hypothetical protein P4L36_06385 [Holophaga sp.]|nr:hypothetical protein [Holophaga sp.]
MAVFLFKLIMTPIFIGLVTLAGRRWGPSVSGLLMGLPLTSGPISVFLALQYGQLFAARAAVGILAGMVSSCVFCLTYGLAARKCHWALCPPVAFLAFVGFTAVLNHFRWNLASASVLLLAAILGVNWLLPAPAAAPTLPTPSRWDLPARMIVATAFVIALTALARSLGPQLSGLISPFPVYGLVMAGFTQRHGGPAAVVGMMRGIVLGALALLAFFLVAGLCLGKAPMVLVYLAASMASAGTSWMAFQVTHGARLRMRA